MEGRGTQNGFRDAAASQSGFGANLKVKTEWHKVISRIKMEQKMGFSQNAIKSLKGLPFLEVCYILGNKHVQET